MQYSVSERECLAVVLALATLRPYLMGKPFNVYTDHSSLPWLMNIVEPSARLMKGHLRVAEVRFTVTYKTRSQNTQPDALFRLLMTNEALL